MPRLKGMKVVICDCGAQVVGFPGQIKACSFCDKTQVLPKKKATGLSKITTDVEKKKKCASQ